jgi:GT2 family glycosyltransferase
MSVERDVMSSGVELSVVIVSYNSARVLGACLESVYRECAGTEIEVFVVDNASTDGTVDLVRERFPAVDLRASDLNLGFSAGNNVVLGQCRGRYVVLLNPDTIVRPGAFGTLIRHLDEHPAVGAVGPALLLEDGELQWECARNLPRPGNLFQWLLLLDKVEWALRYRSRHVRKAVALAGAADGTLRAPRGTLCDGFCLLPWARDETAEVEMLCGACMMIRREIVERLGGLDESSPLFLDDVDYCRRIRDAGWALHFVPEAMITHLWRQSQASLRRAGDFYALGCHAVWLYLRKHHGRTASAAFALMACVAGPIRLVTSLAGLALTFGSRRPFWRRQLHMALGLARWSFRVPKTAPRFGFAGEP